MSSIPNPVIQPGSWILVTGVNGFIGSHIADQLLLAGYKVRGTVRNASKNAWMAEFFESKYGKDVFELIEVGDMSQEGSLDAAMKGVEGVAHVASVLSQDPNPHNVIPPTIAFAVNALKAAAAEPSVKRFVLTSSSTATYAPGPNLGRTIDAKTWNEDSVKAAWAPAPYEPERTWVTYAASKTEGEQAVWKWVEENEPALVVNAVLPPVNFGPALDLARQGRQSTSYAITEALEGEFKIFGGFAPGFFVDVRDTARLHVLALLHPDVKNERIFGFAGSFNWDDVYAVLRQMFPERDFPEPDPNAPRDTNKILPAGRAEGLLREMGRPGWVGLEETVRASLEGVA
ncbi:hypothetical protein W97_02704 [Coniosporium apollinis CBS 100218]|uniref:NAD-dependent epimerase/dehydratase domain-containing protein n=1 Tax=Coniosporium apollinis (strain CBS 100218) TaxID=1168221 RepID=R7YP76_CONA1|nr:uncharacterized protein W97_02704 [Coniosporium apollinis CBS 100218]EON63476.1 hypothetical protein W97_02704 [Coniosporium apollinis CBS 100218]